MPDTTRLPRSSGRRIEVRGTVQGVGFRPWVVRAAMELGLCGRVFNDPRGVVIEAHGCEAALDQLCERLQRDPPTASRVESVCWNSIAASDVQGFAIAATQAGDVRASLAPDMATCPACLADVDDPTNRRYRYAFTSCADCGPRATIVRALPYDRASTTMAGFSLCPACLAEYRDPQDRRYHAQTQACPDCGPRLTWHGADGSEIPTADPLVAAIAALQAGAIVAIKGLGGFHLACDATSSAAVAELRRRKHRGLKPFAVMVADIQAARTVAYLSENERTVLRAPQRPIVLAPAIPGALAADVSPNSVQCGLFLPFTPLHHLLLQGAQRPLVMTSGNVRDAPMARDNAVALRKLDGIADHFLMHDRDIALRCDDSLVRVIAGEPALLRRARGWTPLAIRVPLAFPEPVLALGAQQKNTICLCAGQDAWLSPHVGDLDDADTFADFVNMIEHMRRLTGLEPRLVAHDLHPDYGSTHHARSLPGVRLVGVQHHHAHAAAAMAEQGLSGPVLALALDGTGLGEDGTAWGGELLLCDLRESKRLATLRPLALAGGEAAIRQPWRAALALAMDALGSPARLDDLKVFAQQDAHKLALVRQMLHRLQHVVPAHGAGRYFDAVAALVLGRGEADFEAELAVALEQLADPSPQQPYSYAVDLTQHPWQIDLRPMTRELLHDLRAGVPGARLSARFHETLAAAFAAIVQVGRKAYPGIPVILTGGCMDNALLVANLKRHLAGHGPVFGHRQTPTGDGGLALGQAVVAAARTTA